MCVSAVPLSPPGSRQKPDTLQPACSAANSRSIGSASDAILTHLPDVGLGEFSGHDGNYSASNCLQIVATCDE